MAVLLSYTYIMMIGLLLGSFFNVVGLRVPKGESIISPRSHCTRCFRILGARELVPFFSYIFLRGSCRGCGTKISPIYPITEISTALLFALAPWLIGWSSELFIAWSLLSLLIIICITDLRYHIIPDKVLIVFALIFIALRLTIPLEPWWNMFLGAGIGFILLLLIAIVSKGGMGGGDIKLFAVLGLVLGWKVVLLAFFFSALYGTFFGVIGMVLGKVRRGQPMPFGPAIALGTMTAYLGGEAFVEWYLRLL
ncbi:prepilin peptidase [Bacillus sp. FJAT-18019]|nr:prepilin peptidase [Bacillus sp. FJAT-18019]